MKVLQHTQWKSSGLVRDRRSNQEARTGGMRQFADQRPRTVLKWMGLWLVTATTLVALELLTLFLLDSSPGINLVQASSWAGGFILLARAVDSQSRAALVFLVCGLAVLALTLLSSSLGNELLLIPVAVLALGLGRVLSRLLFP